VRYGSLFSGIGGFDLAFNRAGMECAWMCEIDKHCQDVLGKQFEGVKIYDDVRTIEKDNAEPVDLICGGFPCQDLSVAGKRQGLAGERSGLWFEFARIIDELEPKWVVIENVPGLLSSNRGRDFAIIVQWLAERGYGVAWRVLDAQYFGVPQRRRRVFIVGSLGNGRAAEVLFERESSPRDIAPSREKGEDVARAIVERIGKGGFTDPVNDNIIPFQNTGHGYWQARDTGQSIRTPEGGGSMEANLVAFNIQNNDGGNHKRKDRPNGGMYINETDKSLTVGGTDQTVIAFDVRNMQERDGDVVGTLQSKPNGGQSLNYQDCIAFNARRTEVGAIENISPTLNPGGGGSQSPGIAWHENKGGSFTQSDHAKALRSGASHSYQGVGVRRLTPTECERLQGFPDGWTEGQSDSTRYRQLGNAVAVPVVEWIARRILLNTYDLPGGKQIVVKENNGDWITPNSEEIISWKY
jgi:DNA (cytosine-5)-methyltransferase 1